MDFRSLLGVTTQFRFNDAPDDDHVMNKDDKEEGRNNDSNMSEKVEKAG